MNIDNEKRIIKTRNSTTMKKTVICEYVGAGHPDKMADQVSDALLDAFLEKLLKE